MRIGVTLPQYEIDVGDAAALAARALAFAREAEASDLDSVWVSDHPFALAPDGTASGALEPVALAAWIAAGTARIRVGTLVLSAAMRGAAAIAAAARALAVAAPGRVTVGIGAGWYEPEHAALGEEVPRMAERLRAVRESLEGLQDVRTLIGGSSDAMLAIAARGAHAWNLAWDPPVEVFRGRAAALDRAAGERATARTVGLTVLAASDDAGAARAVDRVRGRAPFLADLDLDAVRRAVIVGTPEACAERIAAYGADEVILAPFVRDEVGGVAEVGHAIRALEPAGAP